MLAESLGTYLVMNNDDYPHGWPEYLVQPGFMNAPPGDVEPTESVYYWWWMYMRQVPDYGPDHPLYNDFGDLFGPDDFRQWWWEHFDLFIEEFPLMTDEQIDLKMENFDTFKIFYKPEKSTAKYHVYTKPDMKALKITLQVYLGKLKNPDLTIYQLFEKLVNDKVIKFGYNNLIKAGNTPAEITSKKNVVTATISRYLKHANTYIKNVGKGTFPNKDQ